MSNGANLSQKVKKTEVEKDIEIIEIMIEIKVEILKILEENVLYAISMVTTQEIVLNLIQEEDILIKENHTVYIINIEEAEAEADQGRENIIILPIKENLARMENIRLFSLISKSSFSIRLISSLLKTELSTN